MGSDKVLFLYLPFAFTHIYLRPALASYTVSYSPMLPTAVQAKLKECRAVASAAPNQRYPPAAAPKSGRAGASGASAVREAALSQALSPRGRREAHRASVRQLGEAESLRRERDQLLA